MAMLTWLGEDELHGNGAGPSFTMAFDGPDGNGGRAPIKFPKGQPVEVNDKGFVEKARNNPFFSVEGEAEPEKRGRGRPSNAEIASRQTATDTD